MKLIFYVLEWRELCTILALAGAPRHQVPKKMSQLVAITSCEILGDRESVTMQRSCEIR